jgi:hypothetical protein
MKTMPVLVLCAVLAACGATTGPTGPQGLSGPTGPKGEMGEPGPGFNPTAAIAAVTPQMVVAGQTLDVAITGSATEWTNGALITFGAGINVSKIISPSPLALIATITVDRMAAPGTRDITVTQNGKQISWKGAFSIQPLYKTEVLGKPGRGALAIVRIVSNDPDFTFDTSWNGTTYLGVKATTSPSSLIVVQDVKARQLELLVSGDIDSPLGMRDLRVINQYGRPTERSFTFPQLFDFADLAEQSFDGGSVTGAFAQPYGSTEYKFQTSSSVEWLASITSTGGAGAPVGHPMFGQMNSTGKFTAATLPLTNSLTFFPYSTPYYFVAFDPTGASGFNYTFTVAPLTKTTETEPNDTKEIAPALTLPSLQSATFTSATDVDMFKVVVTDAEVGRHLRVRTRAGYYSCDSKLEVYKPDGSLFAGPLDFNYHEDLRTDALTGPGEWMIKLTWGAYTTSTWASYRSAYELLVNWE